MNGTWSECDLLLLLLLLVDVVEMLRDGIGIHADVRVLLLVTLKVNLEVAFCRETVAADVALVRTFTCTTRDQSTVEDKGLIFEYYFASL